MKQESWFGKSFVSHPLCLPRQQIDKPEIKKKALILALRFISTHIIEAFSEKRRKWLPGSRSAHLAALPKIHKDAVHRHGENNLPLFNCLRFEFILQKENVGWHESKSQLGRKKKKHLSHRGTITNQGHQHTWLRHNRKADPSKNLGEKSGMGNGLVLPGVLVKEEF